MTVSMRITGTERVRKMLDNASIQVKKKVSGDIMKAAFVVEGEAKSRCPVDTGRLKSSIHSWKSGDFEAQVGDGVDYGVFVEYGTSRMGAQPFLRPALTNKKNEVQNIIRKGIMEVTRTK